MRYVPGFRTYLPPLIQWQPTTTSHDPNPPVTIDTGAVSSDFSAAVTLDDVTALATFTAASDFVSAVTLDALTAAATFTAASDFTASVTFEDVTALSEYEGSGVPAGPTGGGPALGADTKKKKKPREYGPLEIAYIQRVMAEQAAAAELASQVEAEPEPAVAPRVTPAERARRRELMAGISDAMRREGEAEAEAARLKALEDLFALSKLQEQAAVDELARIQGEIFEAVAAEQKRRNRNALLALMMVN